MIATHGLSGLEENYQRDAADMMADNKILTSRVDDAEERRYRFEQHLQETKLELTDAQIVIAKKEIEIEDLNAS